MLTLIYFILGVFSLKFDKVLKLFERFWNLQWNLESLRSSGNIRTVFKLFGKFWNNLVIFGQPWDYEESFDVICKSPDSFKTGWKVWGHLEIFRQFETVWKIMKSFGKIRTGLKPSGKFEINRKYLNRLAPSGRFWNITRKDLESIVIDQKVLRLSENIQAVLKSPGRFLSHLERSGQFCNHQESFESIRKDPNSFETVRKILKSPGKNQTILKPSGKIWDYLEKFGQFWNHPEKFETTWKHLKRLETVLNISN